MKEKDTEVKGILSKRKVNDKLESTAVVNSEVSPTKRKLETEVIDLTESNEGPCEKRARESLSVPGTPLQKGEEAEFEIGSVPARLSKFPPNTLGELDVRLKWISDKESIGTVEKRFEMVFSCKYPGSKYYNHRNLWRRLSDNGAIQALDGRDLWMPIYSANTPSRKSDTANQNRETRCPPSGPSNDGMGQRYVPSE